MKVYIAGIDGYLGWSLAVYLTARGHEIAGCDTGFRRQWVREVGSQSAIPIELMQERLAAVYDNYGKDIKYKEGNICNYHFIKNQLEDFKPDAIVHFAQMPSAPYSMIDVKHSVWTQKNNVLGNLTLLWVMKNVCPEVPLVKIGSMGEYGVVNTDIPEGSFEMEYNGRKDNVIFPRRGGSWYHLTKIHDTYNIDFANRMWGLKCTDIMQGVVYGVRLDEFKNDDRLNTRYDIDEAFGTFLNRACAQAVVNEPITLYGKGKQIRGFLPLRDSMQCLTIALENPPKEKEYRVFNQFEEIYTLEELANKVKKVGNKLGLNVKINHIENPRIEAEEHYYNPEHKHLLDLGYKPTHDMEKEIDITLKELIKYKDRIEAKKEVLIPDIRWDGTKRKSKEL